MEKRKVLVVYYSRTGNTKKVAQEIAKILKADIDEIFDLKKRAGIRGWLGSGRDAFLNKRTQIKKQILPEEHDLVVIGTPIWAGTLTPAIREYILSHKFKKVAFFCTCGDKQTKAFSEMTKLSKQPTATLEIKEKLLKTDQAQHKIQDFCKELKNEI